MATVLQTGLQHHHTLASLAPQRRAPGGYRIDLRKDDMPTLSGMSLSLLTLNPRGIREPHWHPNAVELGYCLQGTAVMTIFSPGNNHDTFTINPGDIAFVPMGALHHIANTGDTEFKMLLCFDNDNPEEQEVSSGVSAMPDHVMSQTFHIDDDFFTHIRHNDRAIFASLAKEPIISPQPTMVNRYRMGLEASNPRVQTPGGTVKMSNGFYLPTLENLALYTLILHRHGVREPHWHPNAHELNYLISGRARITLVMPGGPTETFDMKAGDASFLPRGYLHYIENTGHDDAHFAIFFNHVFPSDIGFSGGLSAFPDQVLASLFGVTPDYFKKLPKIQEDVLVAGGG